MNKRDLQNMIFTSPYTQKGYTGNKCCVGSPTRIQVDDKSRVSESELNHILAKLRWTEARVLVYLLTQTIETDNGIVCLEPRREIYKKIDVKSTAFEYAIKTLEKKTILEKRMRGMYHLNLLDQIDKAA